MTKEKLHFGIGLLLGLVLASLFFKFYAPRYVTQKSPAGVLVKQDKWTGDAWRLIDNEWKKISDYNQSWEEVDKALRKAIGVEASNPKQGGYLHRLRQEYPVLKDYTDEEITERIKLVYSKEVMTELFFSSFMKQENSADKEK